MQDIKKEFSLTYMFISHDLRIIKHFCDRVMVMYLGNIVEIGTKDAIYEKRRHPAVSKKGAFPSKTCPFFYPC